MCIDRFSVPIQWHPISFHQKINERDLEPMSLIKDLGVVCSVICIFFFVFIRHTNRNNVSLLWRQWCTLSPRVPLENRVQFENIIFIEYFFTVCNITYFEGTRGFHYFHWSILIFSNFDFIAFGRFINQIDILLNFVLLQIMTNLIQYKLIKFNLTQKRHII